MKRTLIALFVAALLVSSHAQDGDDNIQVDEVQGDDALQGEGRFQGQDPQMDEAFIENQRTKLWACFFLTKHKLYLVSPELQSSFAEAKDIANKVFNKMVGSLFTNCVITVQVEEGQQILSTLQQKEFDVEVWNHLFKFDLEEYKNPRNINTELDPNESMFVEYYNKMDEQMKEKYGNQDEDGQERDSGYQNLFGRSMDTEPKVGGISVANMSASTKLFYVAAVFGIIAVVFYYAYTKLFVEELSPVEKAKKAREQKKRDKSK